VPQIPDRTAAIRGTGPMPVEAILAGIAVLRDAGAVEIAIACNTSHHWHGELERRGRVPILHIVDAVAARLQDHGLGGRRIGLIATDGTVRAGIYQQRLAGFGFGDLLLPTDAEMADQVSEGIDAVKAGDLERGEDLLGAAADALFDRGCDAVVLGCTEVGVVLKTDRVLKTGRRGPLIDSTEALARLCVGRWSARLAPAARRLTA
jgi:aspartate racemase